MQSPNILSSFIISIIENAIFIGLISQFRNRNKNYKIIDTTVVLILSVIVCCFVYFGICPHVKVIIISIFLFITKFIYKIKFSEQILIIALYSLIITMSESLVIYLYLNIFNASLKSLELNHTYFFIGSMAKVLAILIGIFISKIFLRARVILPKVLNYTVLGTLTFSISSMILLLYSSLNLYSQDIMFILFIISIFTFFACIGVLIIFFNANDYYMDLQKETIKKIYEGSYEKFIKNTEIRNENLSKIWHDIGNHIKVLEMNSTNNNLNKEYMNTIKDKLSEIPNSINTGNHIIDIILNDKYQEAMVQDINFDIKAIVPPVINIDHIDLSSILFNTIDNAIEACINCQENHRYIFLELYQDGNFLCYKIKNAYGINNTNPRFFKRIYFNKKAYISPGYGLSIVNDIVNKYDGHLDITKDGSEFKVSIILNLNLQ